MATATPKHQNQINRLTEASNTAKLGDVIANLVTTVNLLVVQVNALNAKDSIVPATTATKVIGLEGV